MLRLITCFVILFSAAASTADRLPIIDMHLHALPADSEGPAPLAMCTPMKVPAWDPVAPYGKLFMDMAKNPACEDPVWSPMTDEEVMSQTLEIMERRNIIGVLSGTPERVARWRKESPDSLLPGIGFLLGGEREYPVEVLRTLHAEDRLAVFAEIVNQYAGIEPNYRARMHSPLTLEEVLVRHPRLRIPHAG